MRAPYVMVQSVKSFYGENMTFYNIN